MPNKDGTGPKKGGCCGGHGNHGEKSVEHKQGGCCGGHGHHGNNTAEHKQGGCCGGHGNGSAHQGSEKGCCGK